MLLVPLLLLGFISLALANCSDQLSALFKPEFCGEKYFQKLSCELNTELRSAPIKNDAETAQFCLQFSRENQVGLSILDAEGIDLCTLNNPAAAGFIRIGSSLLRRSAADRYSIYLHYDPNTGFPQPPLGDPNMDIIGLQHVYLNITNPSIEKKTQSTFPYIEAVLSYIETYPDSGLQVVPDIQNQVLFATLIASVPTAKAGQYFVAVWKAYQHSSYRILYPNNVGYETSVYLLNVLSWTGIFNQGLSSYSVRAANYNSMKNILLLYQEAVGILRSFSQPLPLNTYRNDVCSYAYNLELPYGIIRRVIFSKSQIISV